jgi:hypothetical protein
MRIENVEEVPASDISSPNRQSVKAVENSKMSEPHGNVIENKGSSFGNQRPSANIIENKASYAQKTGMSLKRKGVMIADSRLPIVDCLRNESRNSKLLEGRERSLTNYEIPLEIGK